MSHIKEEDSLIIEKIKKIAEGVSPDISRQMILVHMFDSVSGEKDFEEVLLSFCKYGNEIPDILVNSGVSSILGEIYQAFNVQLDTKIHGIIGVTDDNTYIFDFLISKLPDLYAKGLIKTRPIDDIMNPKGVLPLMMGELHKNKEVVIEKIKNTFLVMGAEHAGNTKVDKIQDKYSKDFEENLKKVANIFENSDINHFYSVISQLEAVIGNSEGSLLPVEMKSNALPERWTQDMSFLMKSLLEYQATQGKQLEYIYATIKEGKTLPSPASSPTEIIDVPEFEINQDEFANTVKTALSQFFGDTGEEDDAAIESENSKKLDDILKRLNEVDPSLTESKITENNSDVLLKILSAVQAKEEQAEDVDSSEMKEVLETIKLLKENIQEKEKIGSSLITKEDFDTSLDKAVNEIKEVIENKKTPSEGTETTRDDSASVVPSDILEKFESVEACIREERKELSFELKEIKTFMENATEEDHDETLLEDHDETLLEDPDEVDFEKLLIDVSLKVNAMDEKFDKLMNIVLDLSSNQEKMSVSLNAEIAESCKIRDSFSTTSKPTSKPSEAILDVEETTSEQEKPKKKGFFGFGGDKKEVRIEEIDLSSSEDLNTGDLDDL